MPDLFRRVVSCAVRCCRALGWYNSARMPSDDNEPVWVIATITSAGDRKWDVSGSRQLSSAEVEDLQHKGRMINEVAKQRDFERVLEAAQRWLATLDTAQHQLQDRGSLLAGLRIAAALDLVALSRAAELCEQSFATAVQRGGDVYRQDALALRQAEELRHRFRAQPAYLVLQGLAPRARAGDLDLVLTEGEVRIKGVRSHGAGELAHVLITELARVVVAYLDVFSGALEDAAADLEALTEGLPEGGYPQLMRLPSDEAISLPDAHFAHLPIPEAIALREFRRQIPTLTTPERLVGAVVGLMTSGTHHHFFVGETDISGASIAGKTTDSVNALPTARVELDLDLVGSAPVDYWAPVSIDARQGPYGRRLFSGATQEARVESNINLDCEGAVDLSEHNLAGMVAANVEPSEVVRSLVRQVGLPDDVLVLTTEEKAQQEEVFEVFVPVRGIVVQAPVSIGPITIVPTETCDPILAEFDFRQEPTGEKLDAAFRDATAYGLAHARARSLDAAEDIGYEQIQTTMAWLIVRERNGFLRLPDGTAQDFSRHHALRAPESGPVVLVSGTETGRKWLRWPLGGADPVTRDLSADSRLLNPPLPADLSPAERRSLLALRRAVSEVSIEPQLQALWEALESYAAGVKGPKLFSKTQTDELRAAMPDWMDDDQRDKFGKAIDDLNQPPLGIRLGWRTERDAVPLAAHERELVFETLRAARNDVAHGREIKDPLRREDRLLGISVVARIILFGIAARTEA